MQRVFSLAPLLASASRPRAARSLALLGVKGLHRSASPAAWAAVRASHAAPVWARAFSGAVQSFLDKAEVAERVVEVVKGFEKVDPAKVNDGAHFANDLGLDSLDAVEVVMAIEEEFAITIPDAEAEKIASVADAIEFIATHPQAK